FNISALARERRIHIATKPLGYLGTIVVGMAFAAGWTPCIGPILGAVLTYTASSADLSRGLVLLLAYSLGLAVPFVLAALMIDRFMVLFQRYRPALVWTPRALGVLLVAVRAVPHAIAAQRPRRADADPPVGARTRQQVPDHHEHAADYYRQHALETDGISQRHPDDRQVEHDHEGDHRVDQHVVGGLELL